jgi:MarR-like DNA-binding transcriptional regulator SgrR of sgrS sRNA
MNAIGVPVLGPDNRPVAALSVAAIAERLRGDRIPEVAQLLQQEATELAMLLRAGFGESEQRTMPAPERQVALPARKGRKAG